MGRPKKDVDEKLIEQLARIHCTYDEIASIVGVSKSTLSERFRTLIENAMNEGRASLRRQQYKLAMDGDKTMLVWLGKQLLGQRDRLDHELSGPNGGPIQHEDITERPLAELIAEAEAIAREAAEACGADRGDTP